jgi:hypothetical protein
LGLEPFHLGNSLQPFESSYRLILPSLVSEDLKLLLSKIGRVRILLTAKFDLPHALLSTNES